MITEDLISYIRGQFKKNISKDLVTSRLLQAGWHHQDINEGFAKVASLVSEEASNKILNKLEEHTDPYREIPEINSGKNSPVVQPLELNKEEEPKVWTPAKSPEPVSLEADNTVETSTPVREPFIYVIPQDEDEVEKAVESAKPAPVISEKPKESAPDIKPDLSQPAKSEPVLKIIPEIKTLKEEIKAKPETDSLSKRAMISSYAQDLSSVQKAQEETIKQSKSSTIPKSFRRYRLVVIISSIVVLVGLIFAIVAHFKPSILDFSFIKKDPKTLILNSPAYIQNLSSYKINSDINISLPSFSNITAGLVSGEVVSSNDRDSISLNINGSINNSSKSGSLFMYDLISVFKSSIIKNRITTNIKYDGLNVFAKVPDMSELLGNNAPPSADLLFSAGQINSIIPELPESLRDSFANSNLYKSLSLGIPENIKSSVASSFQDFISNSKIVEKEPEAIDGIDTYHYQINSDRQATKKLLMALSGIFVADSPDSNLNLGDKLGAVNIDSLEIWIGQKDSAIHQFKVAMIIPLSKIIGFEDKGIADNQVKININTTYSDFNTPNSISIPKDAMKMDDFIKSIHDAQIKNAISMFSISAKTLHNAEGSFGKRSNISGSCVSPLPISLFSPIGHPKGAATAVGDIAGIMKTLLNRTGDNAGYCYSTPGSWAIAFPLASNPQSFSCADNSGSSKVLDHSISGPVCK